MSMDGEATAPQMKPQDTTNFLLGGMQKQLEAIALTQKEDRSANDAYRTEIRDSITGIKQKLADTASDVEVLKSKQVPRIHPVTVLAGIGAIVAVILTVLDRLYP